jgi:hypothetical protein
MGKMHRPQTVCRVEEGHGGRHPLLYRRLERVRDLLVEELVLRGSE